MSARDDLTKVVYDGSRMAQSVGDVVDAILAAGWRPPMQTISTADELARMPVATARVPQLRSLKTGHVWYMRASAPQWEGTGGAYSRTEDFIQYEAPFEVLEQP